MPVQRIDTAERALRAFDTVMDNSKVDGIAVAQQVFTVVDTLDSSGSLRRALTDPARPGTDKSVLVRQLFAQLNLVQDVVCDFVSLRWSREADLGDALAAAGFGALLAHADREGVLGRVEEELFHVERLLANERELLTALGDRRSARGTRLEVFNRVLGAKLHPNTEAIVARLVAAPRGQRLLTALQQVMEMAATRQSRLVARVVAATELSSAQRDRLAQILTSAYGRQVQLNVAVDPQVIGGISIQVGAEAVDGTILTRLEQARRQLVG